MARVIGNLLLVVVLIVAGAASASGAGRHLRSYGRKVGARSEVRNVEGDWEVQELGRYCVEEHNRRREGCCRLEFARVVSAERQVVAGTKYYLRVVAAEDGSARAFDAVVVVQPWLESPRRLLAFTPADGK